jgi:hypothetical protein
MKQQLICNGDSWVFGSELVDPEIAKKYPPTMHVGNFDHLEENDAYRVPRIFATKLGNMLDAEVTNLSWPADDNQSICNRTIDYLTTNYISQGLPTDNLFVVLGWSSPERVKFWYKDDERSQRYIIWPSLEWHDTPAQKKFWELYVAYLWNREEYIPRFIETVLRFQNFCTAHNIKHLMFNAFYQNGGSGCSHALGNDIVITKELDTLQHDGYQYMQNNTRIGTMYNHRDTWATIDPIRYYCKEQQKNSFRTFISDNLEQPLTGWHPSEHAHSIWAEELFKYIKVNNLL